MKVGPRAIVVIFHPSPARLIPSPFGHAVRGRSRVISLVAQLATEAHSFLMSVAFSTVDIKSRTIQFGRFEADRGSSVVVLAAGHIRVGSFWRHWYGCILIVGERLRLPFALRALVGCGAVFAVWRLGPG